MYSVINEKYTHRKNMTVLKYRSITSQEYLKVKQTLYSFSLKKK